MVIVYNSDAGHDVIVTFLELGMSLRSVLSCVLHVSAYSYAF